MPDLLGLANFGLDDADSDSLGNIYISDSENWQILKFSSMGSLIDTFPVTCTSDTITIGAPAPPAIASEFSIRVPGATDTEDDSDIVQHGFPLNIAATVNSDVYVVDIPNSLVLRYDAHGQPAGEIWAPGALSVCHTAEGVYVLTNSNGLGRVDLYSSDGELLEVLPAPTFYGSRHPDPSLVNLDADREGRVYISYGMPPYEIAQTGINWSKPQMIRRTIPHPEDIILTPDIAVDPADGCLLVLLGYGENGLQYIDRFSPDGMYMDSIPCPHSLNVYSVICAVGESTFCLLDTGTGAGAGEMACISLS